MKDVDPQDLPPIDVLTGGFPCQAFSVAGYRKGLKDDRGNLFFDILRYIKILKPKVVFLENVKILTSHDNGHTFEVIQKELKNAGYYIKSNVLNTAEYSNVPQNRERNLYKDNFKDTKDLIKTIAELRNKRIKSTSGICSLSKYNLLYHCVTRENSKFHLHEEKMNLIDINSIQIMNIKNNTISFNDGLEEYSFNLSKITLFKRFNIEPIYTVDVKIIDDPFVLLEKYLSTEFVEDSSNKIVDTIYLPLYSYKNHKPFVFEKSGLNQWNAGGRLRAPNEVYIPFPANIRQHKPNFFPSRDDCFTLSLPNGEFKMAKVCQDNDKAIMTNPNEDLGKGLLRDVLNLQENELLTYEKLEQIGFDTVQINKFEDNTYEINFKQLGTFENENIVS